MVPSGMCNVAIPACLGAEVLPFSSCIVLLEMPGTGVAEEGV